MATQQQQGGTKKLRQVKVGPGITVLVDPTRVASIDGLLDELDQFGWITFQHLCWRGNHQDDPAPPIKELVGDVNETALVLLLGHRRERLKVYLDQRERDEIHIRGGEATGPTPKGFVEVK